MTLTPNLLRFIAKHPHLEGRVRGTDRGPLPQGPGLLQQAVNYGRAVVRYHHNHGWMLPLELAEPRAIICHSNQCGKYEAKLDKCLHRRCGCTIAEKVTWSTESCPEKLWLPMYGPPPGPESVPAS